MRPCTPDLELLDELIQQTNFSLVQGGSDLGRRNAYAYHFTSVQGFTEIKRHGLGKVPGIIETHEVEYWLAMPFLDPETAACLYMEWHTHPGHYGDISREQHVVQHAVERELAAVKDLRVAWFYRDYESSGSTASHGARCVQFDLHAVGTWLAKHADSPHTFSDESFVAEGYAIAWIGKSIPRTLLSECEW